jgi:hypothetical protein
MAFHVVLRHSKLRSEMVILQPLTWRSFCSVRECMSKVEEVPARAYQMRGYSIKRERLHQINWGRLLTGST